MDVWSKMWPLKLDTISKGKLQLKYLAYITFYQDFIEIIDDSDASNNDLNALIKSKSE